MTMTILGLVLREFLDDVWRQRMVTEWWYGLVVCWNVTLKLQLWVERWDVGC